MAERNDATSFLGSISPEFIRRSTAWMIADLARSGLLPEDMGCTARSFPVVGTNDEAYVIPYHSLAGQLIPQMYRIRMNNSQRYTQPARDQIQDLAVHPYFGKGTALLMGSKIRVICEGEKKAAKFQLQFKVPTAGIPGCDNWRFGREDDGWPIAQPALVEFVRGAERVIFIPDGDYHRLNIGLAYRRLADALEVENALLWRATDKIDDFLVAHPEITSIDQLEIIDARRALFESPEGLMRHFFLTGRPLQNGAVLDANAANVKLLFEKHPTFKGLIRLNTDKNEIEYPALRGDALSQIFMHIARYFAMPKIHKGDVAVALLEEAAKNAYSPRAEWLESLKWDGVERLSTWMIDYMGAADNPFHRAASRASLIAAVARALDPGCFVDFMVILKGRQNIGKNRIITTLFGRENVALKTRSNSEGKDGMMLLGTCWVNVDDEMDNHTRSDLQTIKAEITNPVDNYRLPYGSKVQRFPRRCVLWGTSNESTFLNRDSTGYRRYAIIVVDGADFDLAKVAAVRDQLWAEAVAAWKGGEEYSQVTGASEVAKQFVRDDGFEEKVEDQAEEFARVGPMIDYKGVVYRYLKLDQLIEGVGVKPTPYFRQRAIEKLRSLGWEYLEQKKEEGKILKRIWVIRGT